MAPSRDAPTGRRVRAIPRPRGSETRDAVLILAAASEQPPARSVERLRHEYSLRQQLDAAWAAKPRELAGEHGHTVLLLEDPGGELLSRLLGQPWEVTQFIRVAIGMAAALGSCPRARPHPQGRQASQHPGKHHDRPGLADRLRHCLAPAARAQGSRAARGDRRNTRLHGAGTDRPDEPVGRFAQRSLRPGGHLLRAAHGRFALHRLRADGMDPLPYRATAGPAQRTDGGGAGPALGDRDEAARKDRRGALPDRRPGSRPICGAVWRNGRRMAASIRSRSARTMHRTGC